MAGVSPLESDEWCWGELLAAVNGWYERQRQQAKQDAVIAMQQVGLIALALCGKHLPEVYEAFPFWSEEEVREAKLAKYRRIMEQYAAREVSKNAK